MSDMIYQIDFAILDFFQAHFRCGFLDWLCGLIQPTAVITAICLIACVVLIIFKKTRRCGILALITLTAVYLLGDLAIKNAVARIRPCNLRPIADLAVKAPTTYSFPSGHTGSAFSVTTTIFLHYRKWGIAALAMAVLIGLSRIYLYVHYPTDVLAGMALGVGMAVAVYFIAKKIKPEHQLKKD